MEQPGEWTLGQGKGALQWGDFQQSVTLSDAITIPYSLGSSVNVSRTTWPYVLGALGIEGRTKGSGSACSE